MPVNQTFNNVVYPVPVQGDTHWAPPLTRYLVALGTYAISPAGGTYTLTADLNLGANFGLLAKYYKTSAANPASAGVVRLSNGDFVEWRNFLGNGNNVLGVDSSDNLTYNGVPISTGLTSLSDGKIWIGDASNDPIAQTPSGDITITNTGVTSIGSGVIVNTDINASAAISLSKLAALPTSRIAVTDGSGVLTTQASPTLTELNYVSGVTSNIQTQLSTKALTDLSNVSAVSANVSLNSHKFTNLSAGTGNGDSLRYEQLIGQYLLLTGGTMTGDIVLDNQTAIEFVSSGGSVGTWNSVGSLGTARGSGALQPLPGAKAIIAGGENGGSLSTTEIYSAGTWSAGPALYAANRIVSVVLDDDTVLFCGGDSGGDMGVDTAKVINTAGTIMTAVGSMTEIRFQHRGIKLNDGTVLISGGLGTGPTDTIDTCEIYDPIMQTFSSTGTMTTPRAGHTLALLPDGNVIAIGGYDGSNEIGTTEIYDSVGGTWSASAPLPFSKTGLGNWAGTLSNNKVLWGTGQIDTSGGMNDFYLYDYLSDTWTGTGFSNTPHAVAFVTILSTGDVLVAGGTTDSGENNSSTTDVTEIYDVGLGTWTTVDNLNAARNTYFQGMTSMSICVLTDDSVLITGGLNASATVIGTSELFTVSSTPQTITLKAPATVAANYDLLLPPAQGSGFLTNDGSGNLDWTGSGYVESVKTTPTNFPNTGNWGDLTFIVLTAGTWDITLMGFFVLNGSDASEAIISVTTNAGNDGTDVINASNVARITKSSGAIDAVANLCMANYRVTPAGVTTYYYKFQATYGSGNPQLEGRISAVKVG